MRYRISVEAEESMTHHLTPGQLCQVTLYRLTRSFWLLLCHMRIIVGLFGCFVQGGSAKEDGEGGSQGGRRRVAGAVGSMETSGRFKRSSGLKDMSFYLYKTRGGV